MEYIIKSKLFKVNCYYLSALNGLYHVKEDTTMFVDQAKKFPSIISAKLYMAQHTYKGEIDWEIILFQQEKDRIEIQSVINS